MSERTGIIDVVAEQTMAAALAPFGWTCGPEFWQRYHSDPWVFNLANAVERLSGGELEAIVRDLAASDPVKEVNVDWDETVTECTQCGSRMPDGETGIEHLDGCAFARSVRWVSAHPVSGTTDG